MPKRKKYMYGDGFTIRSARYTSKASTPGTQSKRCERTHWKTSPDAMYSLARSTDFRNVAFGVRAVSFSAPSFAPCDLPTLGSARASRLSSRSSRFTARA